MMRTGLLTAAAILALLCLPYAALADYVYTPLKEIPVWGEEQIVASHVVHRPDLVTGDAKSSKPVYEADPLNVFLVVETGDHHVTVLDGDRFEPIHRFQSRFALHGGPKYSSDGRFVYFASRDGWISKFDMYKLAVVAEVCDRVVVMYAGEIMEDGDISDVYHHPAHPYTLGLMDSIPRTDLHIDRLTPIQGAPPDLLNIPSGCPFHPRCPYVQPRCSQDKIERVRVGETGHESSCFYWEEVQRDI